MSIDRGSRHGQQTQLGRRWADFAGHAQGFYVYFSRVSSLMGNELVQIRPDGQSSSASGVVVPPLESRPLPPETVGAGKTFYIETFGCQMNEHDSEKVAGVLLARGYRPVDSDDEADFVLYNTCSIREKAAHKVFSRLGAIRKERRLNPPVIGVLGCVAQQEGEQIFARAPWVSLVCGSASYRNLPEMLVQLEAGNRRITGLDDRETDECFETEFTTRTNPHRGYITI